MHRCRFIAPAKNERMLSTSIHFLHGTHAPYVVDLPSPALPNYNATDLLTATPPNHKIISTPSHYLALPRAVRPPIHPAVLCPVQTTPHGGREAPADRHRTLCWRRRG